MNDLDPVIHATTRLRIMTALKPLGLDDKIAFNALAHSLGLTPGNLSVHLTKLADAGYVAIEKTFERRKPATYVALTPQGRAAFEQYLLDLRALLAGAPTDPGA
ncbi:MAG: transcriptional regulator [Propionibacteriaceae bacterium]|jgi:DNA-binding MarR family transcriptional regulator|nr:transcriptional regulator [Propionibacteriaceae bacterium]